MSACRNRRSILAAIFTFDKSRLTSELRSELVLRYSGTSESRTLRSSSSEILLLTPISRCARPTGGSTPDDQQEKQREDGNRIRSSAASATISGCEDFGREVDPAMWIMSRNFADAAGRNWPMTFPRNRDLLFEDEDVLHHHLPPCRSLGDLDDLPGPSLRRATCMMSSARR